MKKVFTHMLIPKKSTGFLPRRGGTCLFLFTIFLVLAPERAKDESNQTLPGAGVLVKSAFNSVATEAAEKHFTHLLL